MNLYQFSNDPVKLSALKVVLQHGRTILNQWVKGERSIEIYESLYLGSLVLDFANSLGKDPSANYQYNEVQGIALRFHFKAVKSNKGRTATNEEQGRVIDIKYVCTLFKDWIANKPILADDALYIGFLLLSFAREAGVNYEEELQNPETIKEISLRYYSDAIQRKSKDDLEMMAKIIEVHIDAKKASTVYS